MARQQRRPDAERDQATESRRRARTKDDGGGTVSPTIARVQQGEPEGQHERDEAERESTIHVPSYAPGPRAGWNGGCYSGR